jgi:predicted AlkP superfamily pyrophosphatase or phosphodiesterase
LMGVGVIVEDMLIPWDKVEFAIAVYKELEKRDLHPNEVSLAVELDAEGKRTFISPLIIFENKFLAPLLKEIYKDYEVPKKEEEDGKESLMFVVPWYDIMYTDVFSVKEEEYRLTRKEFEALLAKGKVYIRFWWD